MTQIYPTNWPELAQEIKAACDWQCQKCGKQCRRPGEPRLTWETELTVAHYDHVYDVPEVFVVALCVPCHLRHDAPFAWWHRHQRRRIFQSEAGQLDLLTL
jgi:hypothetical protein